MMLSGNRQTSKQAEVIDDGSLSFSDGNVKKDGMVLVQISNADDARLAELGYKGEFRREFSVSIPEY